MRTRLDVLDDINETFERYCHACPHEGKNTASTTCQRCPVRGKLREHGAELGWPDDGIEPIPRKGWAEEEEQFLLRSHGDLSVGNIAQRLGRPYNSVTKKISVLRRQGRMAKKAKRRIGMMEKTKANPVTPEMVADLIRRIEEDLHEPTTAL